MCDCDRALELISLGLDGEWQDDGRRELEEHLNACPACRSLARELEQLHAAMPELEEAVPEGFHQAVMDRVRAEKVTAFPARKKVPLQKWASMAAVFAVLLIGAGTLRGYLGMGGGAGNAAPPVVRATVQEPYGDAQSQSEENAPADAASEGDGLGAAPGITAGAAPSAGDSPRSMPEAALFSADEGEDPAQGNEGVQKAADETRSPSEQEWETLAANCAAWVEANGRGRVDTGVVSVQPVTQADLEAVNCGETARERLDMDDWRVTVGDAAGGDYLVLVCDGGTLEVLGEIPHV